jgi:hypothetical protein
MQTEQKGDDLHLLPRSGTQPWLVLILCQTGSAHVKHLKNTHPLPPTMSSGNVKGSQKKGRTLPKEWAMLCPAWFVKGERSASCLPFPCLNPFPPHLFLAVCQCLEPLSYFSVTWPSPPSPCLVEVKIELRSWAVGSALLKSAELVFNVN